MGAAHVPLGFGDFFLRYSHLSYFLGISELEPPDTGFKRRASTYRKASLGARPEANLAFSAETGLFLRRTGPQRGFPSLYPPPLTQTPDLAHYWPEKRRPALSGKGQDLKASALE